MNFNSILILSYPRNFIHLSLHHLCQPSEILSSYFNFNFNAILETAFGIVSIVIHDNLILAASCGNTEATQLYNQFIYEIYLPHVTMHQFRISIINPKIICPI